MNMNCVSLLQFYLRDTKSSNGTFVNNQRLSKGGEESPPKEIFSGDIVQLGVDIVENAKKTTFSCIIAMTKLFHPDGREALRPASERFVSINYYYSDVYHRSDSMTSLNTVAGDVVQGGSIIHAQELFQLHQYVREAMHRFVKLQHYLN
jgi:hypothetical protein